MTHIVGTPGGIKHEVPWREKIIRDSGWTNAGFGGDRTPICNHFSLRNFLSGRRRRRWLDVCRHPSTTGQSQGSRMNNRGKLNPRATLGPLTLALLSLLFAQALVPIQAAWGQVGSARYSAIIVEAGSGKIIMGVNQDELRFPASLTKLMTLYLTFEALRDRRVQLNQEIPVSAWAAEQPPSNLGLQPGEGLTVEQAILG